MFFIFRIWHIFIIFSYWTVDSDDYLLQIISITFLDGFQLIISSTQSISFISLALWFVFSTTFSMSFISSAVLVLRNSAYSDFLLLSLWRILEVVFFLNQVQIGFVVFRTQCFLFFFFIAEFLKPSHLFSLWTVLTLGKVLLLLLDNWIFPWFFLKIFDDFFWNNIGNGLVVFRVGQIIFVL